VSLTVAESRALRNSFACGVFISIKQPRRSEFVSVETKKFEPVICISKSMTQSLSLEVDLQSALLEVPRQFCTVQTFISVQWILYYLTLILSAFSRLMFLKIMMC